MADNYTQMGSNTPHSSEEVTTLNGATVTAQQAPRSALSIVTSDGHLVDLRADNSTYVLEVIDYAHHEVHAGSHFMYTDAVTLASAGTQDYLITTPNTTTWAHMTFALDGSAITQWQLYEGADKDGTTPQTVGNNNRNSATAATTTVHKGTSGGTTDGTLLWLYKGGSATQQSRSGTDSGNTQEIILKQNTKYILRVTSGTADNLTNVKLEWYEHVSKTA